MAHAHAALQLIANASVQAGARARGVAHRAHAAPANHSTWNFFSFRGASGIVQSCIRDGWSSHSHVEKRRLGGGHPSNVGSRPFPVPALALLAPGGAPEPDERLRPHPARAGQRRRALASNPRLPQFVVSASPGPTRALLFSAYEWLLITPRSYSSIPALMWDVPLYSVRRYSCPCACACACPCACVCAWGLLWLAEFHLSIHLSGHKAFLGPEEVKGVTACLHVWGRTVYRAHICRCTRLSPKNTRPWRTIYRPTSRPKNALSMRGPTRLPSCGACSPATRPRRRRPWKRCPYPSVAADRRVGGRHAAYIRWLAAARSAGVALRHLRY